MTTAADEVLQSWTAEIHSFDAHELHDALGEALEAAGKAGDSFPFLCLRKANFGDMVARVDLVRCNLTDGSRAIEIQLIPAA